MRAVFYFSTIILCLSTVNAQVSIQRHAPPPGIPIPPAERRALESGVEELKAEVERLRRDLRDRPEMLELIPDIAVYLKAVDWPLRYGEFYRTNEFAVARRLLQRGLERARQLGAGDAPWTTATGLVVRAYISKIDGSIQPYGLVVPASYQAGAKREHRLDVWLHGRDNHLTELKFIDGRESSWGAFAPTDAFVLHPYGRYCNAFKFAGEVDVFEALDHVRRHYRIDERRLAVRGFSMGGAGCWHLAVHHAGLWAAAAPGAGFAETAEYTGIMSKDPAPTGYEQRLWHLYDATDYAANLFQCRTIAYNGELDKQKQAADVMERAMAAEGLNLERIIGPGTAHKYEPGAKTKLARRIDAIVSRGQELIPREIHFTTWTVRYNQMRWVTVDRLKQHWQRARVDARIIGDGRRLEIKTDNVGALSLHFPARHSFKTGPVQVEIDGKTVDAPAIHSSREWRAHLSVGNDRWQLTGENAEAALQKRHELQGPIDDAFMESFIIVRPTGSSQHPAMSAWVNRALEQFQVEWRAQFRGEARVKDDTEIAARDIAGANLILWGDPRSNKLLARILPQLPLRWGEERVTLGGRSFSAGQHVPVLIYPNPLNPRRYVVLNSGFTFFAAGAASNALQVPRLPDYAILDISPDGPQYPRDVRETGFFDEAWKPLAQAAVVR